MSKLNILITDDYKLVREGIKVTLTLGKNNNRFETIDEASNGWEAYDLCKDKDYDIIFMDINMPEMDGIETTKKIIKETSNKNIIALSMFNEEFQINGMINAGAKGYLLKNAGNEELNNAINAVIGGSNFFSNEIALKMMKGIVNKNNIYSNSYKDSHNDNNSAALTKREKEILILIASEYTNEEIANKLGLSKRTVDTHRHNIINKLNVRNTAGLIKYAIRNELI